MQLRRPRYGTPDSVVRQLARRRWTRRAVFTFLILLAVSAFLDRLGVFRHHGDDWRNFDRKVIVVSDVIDGDTIRVRRASESPKETVRLLGIDAPETNAHFGPEAARHLQQLIEGKPVTLRLDTTQTRDKYRRLLAYVYVSDAENLNLSLVQSGHAYAYRDYHHSMRRQFEQAEDQARAKESGLWGSATDEQMPAWRQRWLAEMRKR